MDFLGFNKRECSWAEDLPKDINGFYFIPACESPIYKAILHFCARELIVPQNMLPNHKPFSKKKFKINIINSLLLIPFQCD